MDYIKMKIDSIAKLLDNISNELTLAQRELYELNELYDYQVKNAYQEQEKTKKKQETKKNEEVNDDGQIKW